jgi:hypothetical protein
LIAAVSRCHNKELDSAPVTSGDLQQLELAAKRLSEAGQTTSQNQELLEALYFRTLQSRSYQIEPAHAETFKWAYSNDPKRRLKFREWLETRKGVFWIYGKPGSGKSTLMKFLYYSEETKTILQSHWAGQKRLVLAKFFFWNAGEPLQKSQAGMLRSLLFEILRQCPELIPAARSAMRSWPLHDSEGTNDLEELLSIYNAIISQSTGIRFCFFIDGLDEFQETRRDPVDLIKTLHALDCSPDIKLCVSSRPWTVFDDEFGCDCIWTLKLEDLTRDDIYRYVNDKFHTHPQFRKLVTRDPNYSKLVDEVTDRAQGVFLWVYLVIRTLLQGLTYHDSLLTMQRRLKTFPPDLEAFFHHLIESVDTIYRRQTARYFSVAVLADGPISAMLFSFLDDIECNEAECLERPIAAMKYPEIEDRRDQLRRRLDGATKGLLELTDRHLAPDPYVRFQVDFLHRTVRDFLYDSVFMDASFRESLGGENAALTALHAALGEMKASPDDVKLLPRQFILFLKDALAEAMAEGSFIKFLDVEGPRLARKSVFSALDFTLYLRSRLYTPSGRMSRSHADKQADVSLLRVVKSVDDILLETTRLLLCQGYDVNRIMRSGALRYSIWSHFLMEYVGWANVQEPKTIAIQLGSLCRLLRILLSHGADPEATVYVVGKGTFPASEVLVMMLGPDATDQLLSETEAPDSEGRGSPIRQSKGAEPSASKERSWPKVSQRYPVEPATPKAKHSSTVQPTKRADTIAAGGRFLEPWDRQASPKAPLGYSVQRPTSNAVYLSTVQRTKRPDTGEDPGEDTGDERWDRQDWSPSPSMGRADTPVAGRKDLNFDDDYWTTEPPALKAECSSMAQLIERADVSVAGGRHFQDYSVPWDSQEYSVKLRAPEGPEPFSKDKRHSPVSQLQDTSGPPAKNKKLSLIAEPTRGLRRILKRI